MDKAKAPKQVSKETEQLAAQRAAERVRAARWGLDVAIFLFAILIIVMTLLFQGIGIEITAPIAVFGLAIVWLMGWRRGRQLYEHFYDEELSKLEQELKKAGKGTLEETIDEKVRRALRERRR